MGDDLVAATFHHHLDRAVTVHLASALRVRDSDASTTSESLIRRALPRMRPDQLTKPHEESGLAAAGVKLAGPLASILVKTTLDFASSQLKDIQQDRKDGAKAAIAYLEVANAA